MEKNYFINKDNLVALRDLPDNSIDMIYADPPFNTGWNFGEYSDKYTPKDTTTLHGRKTAN